MVRDDLNDDMLPGPYDPSEDFTVSATRLDLRPAVGTFSRNPLFLTLLHWLKDV